MKHLIIPSVCLSFFVVFGTVSAQIPQTMSYQGVLSDSEGNLVSDRDYSITCNLYTSSTGGLSIWSETQTVTVTGGIVNATLGSIVPLSLEFDQPYWLGISVDGGAELTPRTNLTSSAYAFNTKSIPDHIVTGEKVEDGNLVRSINSLTDDITISGGSNISISQTANDIMISSYGGSSFTLPYEGSTSSVTNAFSVTNTNYGNTIYSKNTSTGTAGIFESDSPGEYGFGLLVRSNSDGEAFESYTTGRGSAGQFTINNPDNPSNAIDVSTNGRGFAGYFRIDNPGSNMNTIHSATNGSGSAVFGFASGTGNAAKFIIDNSSNNNEVIFAQTNGGGFAVYAENTGTTGFAGRFDITNPSNSHTSLQALTSGSGRAIYCAATNDGNVTNYGGYFVADGSTGYAVWGEARSTSGVNYGGHFSTASSSGYAIRGHATNTEGENYGGTFRADGNAGRGVSAYGRSYDFYAAGPGVDYGTSSSIRWKNNITEIENPLEKIAQLRGVYFDWDAEHGGRHDVGMIAEEVGKVLPEIVSYEENNIDAEGMDYSKITPLLVEAIKEQQRLIEELQKEITQLKALINN